MASAATQVRNVLVRLTIKNENNYVMIGSIEVEGIGNIQLHKYNYVDISPQQLYTGFWETWDSNKEAGFTLSSQAYNDNTRLVDICFNVASSETLPLNTVRLGECSVYNDQDNLLTDVIDYTEVLMGDVDQDGDIDAVDYQKVLKASANTLNPPLTEEQELAADVNRDNRIDAKDTLKISQYTVFKVNSFWDDAQVVLPTVHTDKIVHQGWYRIKNAQTGQYIMGGNTELTKYQATVGIPGDTKAACLKFQINQAANNNAPAGSFSLRCLQDTNVSLYLKLDANYQLTMSATPGEY